MEILSDEDYPPIKPVPKFELGDTVTGVKIGSLLCGSIISRCQVYHNNIHTFLYDIQSTSDILKFVEEDDIKHTDQLILVLEIVA